MGHGESFCTLRALNPSKEFRFEWDASLRAPPRKAAASKSKWLVEEAAGEQSVWPPAHCKSGNSVSLAIQSFPIIMGGNSGGERGVLKSPTYAINSPLIDACIPVVLGKSTMDHSESSNAGRPINISTKSINPPPGFIIGPISIQPIPIMDVDMGPVDEEKLLIQSEGLKRPRMNITTNGSLVHSNPPSFDNVVSVETHSEISACLLGQASRKQ
ncbi:hypothetical protein V6N13_102985 [Hibiscus sabdariffa]